MIPAAFDYHRPGDLAEALALLAGLGDDVKLLAGGQSLIPTMKLRLSQPQALIDLSAVGELRGIRVDGGHLRVGAMTTHWEVESSALVRSRVPLLCEVAAVIADPQVRNRGTMGGSICNADPAADYPAAVLALEAEMVCVGPQGERTVPAADWFLGLFTTALREDEILREIRFPLPAPGEVGAYLKLPHPASRFALVGVAVVLKIGDDGTCAAVRVAVTGAGASAVRATAVERDLIGRRLDAAALAAASTTACAELSLSEDLHFSAEDRADLCRAQVQRALAVALARARQGFPTPA